VQVPRAGYAPAIACAACRTAARCPACHGPLQLEAAAGEGPRCAWCGRLDPAWACPECGGTRLRAIAVGAGRTAEELGRAFAGAGVVYSAKAAPGGIRDEAPAAPGTLVVATPGSEPRVEGGYQAVALLDGWAAGASAALDGQLRALARWCQATALAKPAGEGGRAALVGSPPRALAGAWLRWDAAGQAARELAERRALGLPPAVRLVAVTGPAAAVAEFVEAVDPPAGVTVLGPSPVAAAAGPGARVGATDGEGATDGGLRDGIGGLPPSPAGAAPAPVRALLRTPLAGSAELLAKVRAAKGTLSARGRLGGLRVEVDPAGL
jgi:primosomal protein N' (replication factor Y)